MIYRFEKGYFDVNRKSYHCKTELNIKYQTDKDASIEFVDGLQITGVLSFIDLRIDRSFKRPKELPASTTGHLSLYDGSGFCKIEILLVEDLEFDHDNQVYKSDFICFKKPYFDTMGIFPEDFTGEIMNIYYSVDFLGYWTKNASAIVVAKDEDMAKEIIYNRAKLDNLDPVDVKNITVELIKPKKENAWILSNGR